MKRSTAMRSALLAAFKTQFDGSIIGIFSGPVPTTADAALSPTDHVLLCAISKEGNGTGVTFDSDTSQGVLVKNPSELWKGEVRNGGTATFFRMFKMADDQTAASTVLPRLQGTVGLLDADLNLSSVDFVPGNERRLKTFTVAVPAG